ncbi:MAG: hypothetical protein Q8Q62_00845 [Mesorhizobium sp.]|nr:hypothetical protein [Mesorhizobium sp.]
MDAIEQAIRNAFAKGDPEDAAFREKVYRSAAAALEKALQANPALTSEAIDHRRRNLFSAISGIESEFIPAAPEASPAPSSAPVAAPPVSVVPEVRRDPAPETRRDPAPAVHRDPSDRREPAFGASEAAADWPASPSSPRPSGQPGDIDGDFEDTRGRAPATSASRLDLEPRSRPWGLIGGLLVLFIILGLAFWTAAELGFVDLSGSRGTGAAQTTHGNGGQDAAPRRPGDEGELEDWITVFSPSAPTTVSAPAGATAEVVETNGEQLMRISSGKSGAPVSFDIGAGVLERLAGKRAVFDIVARSGEGGDTQISVSCNLGKLGDCGSNRYVVRPDRTELLFEIDVPAGAPGAAGTIAIVSDVSNKGHALELYEIRVTIPD